ncbi:MAG: TatD family hydrolase [Bacteroidota bacterium]
MFIDSHAHLFFKDYQHDLDEVIKRARDEGIEYIINPGTDLETSRKAIALAEKYDMVYSCVGFHPHDASKADDKSLEEIEKLSYHPKVVAIGEIGLDYHYDFSPREIQRKVFAAQIEIAGRRNLPIVIHSRESEEDVLSVTESMMKANPTWRSRDENKLPRGVFHCFPGDVAMARKVIDWNFYISIPGPITFTHKTKPNTMAEVVKEIPLEDILLETDSPYLTPVPLRGKRNEPANIPLIAKKIADIRQVDIQTVGKISSENVKKLFGIT